MSGLLSISVLVFAVYVTLYASLSQPRWNWDLIGTFGCAYELSGYDVASAHRWTYRDIDRELTASRVNLTLRSGDPFRTAVYEDPHSFAQQLPFYRTRPLYNLTVALAVRLGVLGSAWSTIWVSCFAAALTAYALFLWLRRHCSAPLAALGALLVFAAAPVGDGARSPSPDALAALLIVAGLALAQAPARLHAAAGLTLLALATAARPDMLILAVPLVVALALTEPNARRRLGHVVATVAAMVLFVTIQKVSGFYGWSTLFFHTFVEPLTHPATLQVTVSWDAYVDQLSRGLHSQGHEQALLYTGLAIGLAVFARRRSPRIAAISVAITVNMVAQYLLFPVWWAELFVAQYTVVAGVAILFVAQVTTTPSSRERSAGLPCASR